jgi:predicted unusual protein kinase regulating ubiquinone biosynthesis (AarF/ABC1/UbiB family)
VRGIERVVSQVAHDSFRLDKVQTGSVLESVLALVRDLQVPIDQSLTNLILAIIVLEGLGRQLDPSLEPLLVKLDKRFAVQAVRALAAAQHDRRAAAPA